MSGPGNRRAALVLWCAGMAACGGSTPVPDPPAARPAAPALAPARPEPAKVLQFYASPAKVAPGEETIICYGVENADTVRIEPEIRKLTPSRNRCFSFAPPKSATYRLTAAGPAGRASATLTVTVEKPVEPDREMSLITLFLANQTWVPKGQAVTLCYGLEGADQVSLEPAVRELDPVSSCFTVKMEQTTTFRLKAFGRGRTEEKEITVEVR